MSLSSTTNRVSYIGDGSSATFSFPYYFFSQSDLAVYLYDTTNGLITNQVLNTNYTVTGTPNGQGLYSGGGNVVMASALVSTTYIVITRAPSEVQNFILQQNATIPSNPLTQQFDYLTLLVQRQEDQNTRSVRLPDGFQGTFDPTLPTPLASASNAYLVLNASSTGWAFAPNNGGFGPAGYPLVANGSGVIATYQPLNLAGGGVTGTLPESLGGTGATGFAPFAVIYANSGGTLAGAANGPAGRVLTANASSAPTYQTFGASSFLGTIWPVDYGGTGTGAPYNQYGLIYASSSTAFSTIPSTTTGLPLLAQGSSPPAFTALSLAGAAVTGTLPVVQGGTGNPGGGSSYLQFGVVIMSSLTQMTTIPPIATAGTVLTFNSGAAPSWQPASTLTQSGILSILNGGTGTGVAGAQYSLPYYQTTSALGSIPSTTAGLILTANGSSAPTYQSVTYGVTTRQTNYLAVNTDNLILCNSGAMTITLFNPVGNTGKVVQVKRLDTGGVVTVSCSTATVDGSSFQLFTQFESVSLCSDGTNWYKTAYDYRRVSGRWTAASCAVTNASLPVSWKSTDYDKFGLMGPTGNIVINQTGLWQFTCQILQQHTVVAGDAIIVGFHKTGATASLSATEVVIAAGQTLYGVMVTDTFFLQASDYITVKTLNQNTSPTISTGSNNSWVTATFLGQS